jgi:hypothetical protein
MKSAHALIVVLCISVLSGILGALLYTKRSSFMPTDDNDDKTIKSYDGRPLLILCCVSVNDVDDGGFGYHLFQVLTAHRIAQSLGLSLVVKYSKGYYMDLEKGPNWFEYFFEPLHTDIEDKLAMEVLQDGQGSLYELRHLFGKLPHPNDLYVYTQASFQLVKTLGLIGQGNPAPDWLRLKPSIAARIDDFVRRKFKKKMLAIHYRGTDKYFNTGSHESMVDNYHPTYDAVLQHASRYLQSVENVGDWGVFVCSDEQAFVDAARRRFKQCCFTDAARSSITTSGLRMHNTEVCNNHTDFPQCKELRKLAAQSVHRGTMHVSPYKKGLDAVTEIYLMSKCTALLRNLYGGSFSTLPSLINPGLNSFVVDGDGDDKSVNQK